MLEVDSRRLNLHFYRYFSVSWGSWSLMRLYMLLLASPMNFISIADSGAHWQGHQGVWRWGPAGILCRPVLDFQPCLPDGLPKGRRRQPHDHWGCQGVKKWAWTGLAGIRGEALAKHLTSLFKKPSVFYFDPTPQYVYGVVSSQLLLFKNANQSHAGGAVMEVNILLLLSSWSKSGDPAAAICQKGSFLWHLHPPKR